MVWMCIASCDTRDPGSSPGSVAAGRDRETKLHQNGQKKRNLLVDVWFSVSPRGWGQPGDLWRATITYVDHSKEGVVHPRNRTCHSPCVANLHRWGIKHASGWIAPTTLTSLSFSPYLSVSHSLVLSLAEDFYVLCEVKQ
ncbi:hypothetical protein J4Q44_G00389040 [Coregonus suidteri]|uniref:Uncharacterized protein n=1 Tax=Coregonus suidteri TaxID=861788 RepID=A0AAN8KG52_9TELE